MDPDTLKNYRPVANVPYVSKLIEKTVKDQIDDFLSENDLYCKFQSAYRKNFSTETALIRVHNDIMVSLDVKRDVILILLDFSAAFETIDHRILLHRLETRFGFAGEVLQWFSSYLANRKQYVSVASNDSSVTTPICGVPQGTTLGPILFILYTSPLEEILTKHGLNPMFFSDDTQLYITCEHYDDIKTNVELCIDEIKLWVTENLLVMNDSKTEVIHFRSKFKNNERLESIRVGDAFVEAVPSVRNLGVCLP